MGNRTLNNPFHAKWQPSQSDKAKARRAKRQAANERANALNPTHKPKKVKPSYED